MFTDIVGSTERAAELGDRRWRQVLARHHATVRRLLRRHGGREIDTAGDGFFATFDQPAQAIECAVAIGRAVRPLGIQVRAGIHVGEVELTVDKVAGIAVHIGSRVMSTAAPGEVLVSNTVRDLLSGSEFRFEDRGLQTLKGIPGEWRLAAVTEVLPREDEEFPEEEAPRKRRWRSPIPLFVAIALGVIALLIVRPLVLDGGEGGLAAPAIDTVVRIDPSADEVLGGIPVGRTPIAIAGGDGQVWVANFEDGTVQSIDPSDNRASSAIGLGFDQAPTGMAVGGGFVWITSSTTGYLYQLDPTQSHGIIPIDLGAGVNGVAYGEGAVWVTNGLASAVLRIDPQDPQTEPTTIDLGPGAHPAGIAVGAGSVWVAESLQGQVIRINPDTATVIATIPIQSGGADQVAWGEGFLWATDTEHDTVIRIDPTGNSPTTISGVGNGPAGVAAGNGFAWVANSLDGTVAKIDPASAEVVGAPYRLGSGVSPDRLAIAEGAVWVTVHGP